MKKYRLTNKHIEYFKGRVTYWAEQFQLSEWEFAVRMSDDDDDDLAYAEWELESKTSAIYLKTTWQRSEPTNELLDNVACHEVLEVMISKITDMLRPIYNSDYIDEVTHTVINRIIRFATK